MRILRNPCLPSGPGRGSTRETNHSTPWEHTDALTPWETRSTGRWCSSEQVARVETNTAMSFGRSAVEVSTRTTPCSPHPRRIPHVARGEGLGARQRTARRRQRPPFILFGGWCCAQARCGRLCGGVMAPRSDLGRAELTGAMLSTRPRERVPRTCHGPWGGCEKQAVPASAGAEVAPPRLVRGGVCDESPGETGIGFAH
jgi:hypothetical protein